MSWYYLPEEVKLHVFSYLPARELCVCGCVSREWKVLSSKELLWSALNARECFSDQKDAAISRAPTIPTPRIELPRLNQASAVGAEKIRFRNNVRWRKWSRGIFAERVWDFPHHTGRISGIQFDDDKLVLSSAGPGDNAITIVDLLSGEIVKKLEGHEGWVDCFMFDHRGMLVSGSYDRTIKIWNMGSGGCWATLKGHQGTVRAIQLDEHRIISGSADRTVKVWDLPNEVLLDTIVGYQGWISCLKSQHNLLVCGGSDGLFLWDIRGAKGLTIDKHHTKPINAIHLDGQRLASGGDDGMLHVYDVRTGHVTNTLCARGAVYSLQFDENTLVYGSAAGLSLFSIEKSRVWGDTECWNLEELRHIGTRTNLPVRALQFDRDKIALGTKGEIELLYFPRDCWKWADEEGSLKSTASAGAGRTRILLPKKGAKFALHVSERATRTLTWKRFDIAGKDRAERPRRVGPGGVPLEGGYTKADSEDDVEPDEFLRGLDSSRNNTATPTTPEQADEAWKCIVC